MAPAARSPHERCPECLSRDLEAAGEGAVTVCCDCGHQWTDAPSPAALLDTPTPPAQAGLWVLTAPDGRQWQAESPIACARFELSSRVPASVAVARIFAALNEAASDQADAADAARFRALVRSARGAHAHTLDFRASILSLAGVRS